MKKKQTHEMKLNNAPFKMIKKNKKSIELRLNDEKRQEISIGDYIVFTNIDTNKILKKKVKKLHKYSDFEELYKNIKKNKLGYRRKETASYTDMEKYYSKEDIKKYGVVGIELKISRKIFRKILLALLAIILLLLSMYLINNQIQKFNDNKISKAINNIKKEEISYVFVDINPSLVLTMKDNRITNVACINEDCISIYNDINVKDKNISETIDYLYKLSKDKGFDTSNGVKIKSTTKIEIADTDYIKVELITEATKEELLSEVKNNESIKDINNDDYNTNLWNELKKDNDYGKLYSCNIDNKELKCYVTENFENRLSKCRTYNTYKNNVKVVDEPRYYGCLIEVMTNEFPDLERVLKKFNVPVSYYTMLGIKFVDGIYINGNDYIFGEGACVGFEHHNEDGSVDEKNYCYDKFSITIPSNDSGFKILPISKLNLIKLDYKLEDIVVVDFQNLI